MPENANFEKYVDQLEAVLLDYIARFGMSPRARELLKTTPAKWQYQTGASRVRPVPSEKN